jgi:hypothetical protein
MRGADVNQLQFSDVWTAAGVLLGFQVTSFAWRLSREVDVGDKRAVTWLPPADLINMVSMVILVGGVYLSSTLGLVNISFVVRAFGLSTLLFVGYPFALAGHYEMYNRHTSRSFAYFPRQEKIVTVVVVVLGVTYCGIALTEK